MMKQPTEDDFTVVEVLESGVTVLFEPTQSFLSPCRSQRHKAVWSRVTGAGWRTPRRTLWRHRRLPIR
jgi:hypothetical protein